MIVDLIYRLLGWCRHSWDIWQDVPSYFSDYPSEQWRYCTKCYRKQLRDVK